MNRPFLDDHIHRTLPPGKGSLPERLEAFQTRALKTTLAHASSMSRFYRKRLNGIPINRIQDISGLPFTRGSHIQDRAMDFLCLSQDEISRIVTLETSGTTNRPKRIFFTDSDLDSSVDFFSSILSHLMVPKETGLIFLPGPSPASAGDLIRTAMENIGARGIVHGIITDFHPVFDLIKHQPPALIIGMPVQVLALGEFLKLKNYTGPPIPHVILTADHVPEALAARVEALFGCRVLTHYGMTETGFGGAIQCPAQEGLHLRLTDLLFEIIDPHTGTPLPPGQWGEIVVTTLNRTGMPLIRYRTGDVSRRIDTPCACGSLLPRLDKIRNRQAMGIAPDGRIGLTMADLDDIFFALPGVVDFRAHLDTRQTPPVLDIELMSIPTTRTIPIDLDPARVLKTTGPQGEIRMGTIKNRPFDFNNTYVKKRQILYNL